MSAGDWKELYQAVEQGNFDLAQYHIKSGTDLNHQHPEIMRTVLVTAIRLKQTKIALLLLNHGADPELESYYDQRTPLQAALKCRNAEIINRLKCMNVKTSWLQKIKIILI